MTFMSRSAKDWEAKCDTLIFYFLNLWEQIITNDLGLLQQFLMPSFMGNLNVTNCMLRTGWLFNDKFELKNTDHIP